jgi:integrase
MQARKRTGNRHRAKPWYVQYRDTDGKQKSPGFATKGEADAWIRENAPKIHARKQLVPIVPSDSTVAAYGPFWLTAHRASIKPRTQHTYAAQLRLYIVPRLGPRPVAEITRPEVRAFLAECRERGVLGKPLAKGAVYAIFATLRALMSAAVEDGLRLDNPAAKLGKPMHLNRTAAEIQAAIRGKVLDREQLEQLLEYCRTQEPAWYPLFLTLARIGLRIGEAVALQLDDYNPTAMTLRIERQWDDKNDLEGTPKSGARLVDVSPQLATVLDAHTVALTKVVGLDGQPVVEWLFPSATWTMLDEHNVRRALRRIAERALGRHFTPHQFRHTFASLLIADAESPGHVYVQRQLGHGDISTTMRFYGSGLPLEARRGVALLDSCSSAAADGGTMVARSPKSTRRRRRA